MFRVGSGDDRIDDFDLASDLLSATSDRASVSDGADGAVVGFVDGGSVTLVGVSAAAVTDALFL